jgi:microcystin-dependent protein
MAINFPNNPTNGQIFSEGNKSWQWLGNRWGTYNISNIINVPTGAVMPFAMNSAPIGWLAANGAAVSRTTYSTLFSTIGTIYGVGDGVNTFNLPDLRQKFAMGKAASGTGNTLAGTGGAIDHTHSVPAHHHAMGTGADLNITSSGSHTHTATTNAFYEAGGLTNPGFNNPPNWSRYVGGTVTVDAASHTHSSASFAGKIGLVTGGVDGNAAMTSGTQNPPYLVVNYIIKAA